MAVQRTNNAEGAPVGSDLVSANTGGASGDQLTWAPASGTPSFQATSTGVIFGTKSYQLVCASGSYGTANWTDVATVGYERVHLKIVSFSGATDYWIVRCNGSAGTMLGLNFNATGQLVVKDSLDAVIYTSAAGIIPLDGSAFCLEYCIDPGIDAVTGKVRFRVWTGAGTPYTLVLDQEVTGKNLFRAGGITSRRVGKNNGTGAITIKFDAMEIGNTYSLPGPLSTAVVQYDVVVGIGQSNMRGAAQAIDASDYYDANVYQWMSGTNTIVPATEPLHSDDAGIGLGPINRFVRSYIAAGKLTGGRSILIVQCARGGTGFSRPDSNGTQMTWQIDDAGGVNLYDAARANLTSAMGLTGAGSQIVAVLANHGSTDGINNLDKPTYKSRVSAFMDAFRQWMFTQSYAATNTVRYVMMSMRPDLIAAENRHKILDDAQQELSTEKTNMAKVPSPVGDVYYEPGPVHFSAPGVRIIGSNMYTGWVGGSSFDTGSAGSSMSTSDKEYASLVATYGAGLSLQDMRYKKFGGPGNPVKSEVDLEYAWWGPASTISMNDKTLVNLIALTGKTGLSVDDQRALMFP